MGWGVTLYAVAMLVGLMVLLRAEQRAAGARSNRQQKPSVQVRL